MKGSLPSRYGKWAVVAGASQGFGASFAAELAKRGMNVVLVSSLAGLQGAPRIAAYSASKAAVRLMARNTEHLS